MILNRRTLLASIGLMLPAVAAEAATKTGSKSVVKTAAKTKKKPATHVVKASAHKPAAHHKPATPPAS